MRQFHRAILIAALALVCTGAWGESPTPVEPARVAVLTGAGSRAPSAALLLQTEKAVANMERIELVPRAEIDKVLKEIDLSTSGPVGGQRAKDLGERLNAEVLLYIIKPPRGWTHARQLLAIEAETGILLGTFIEAEEALKPGAAEPARFVSSTVAKARLSPEERRYVELRDFRGARAADELDALAHALAEFLSIGLASSPQVVIVNPTLVRHVKRDISPLAKRLWEGRTMIDGTVGRDPDNGGHVSLALRFETTSSTDEISVSLDLAKLPDARAKLASEVLAGLAAAGPVAPVGPPRTEAAALFRQLRIRQSMDYDTDAVRAGEAAFLLNPSQGLRSRLAFQWRRLAGRLQPGRPRRSPEGYREEHIGFISCRLRTLAIVHEMDEAHARDVESGRQEVPVMPSMVAYKQGYRFEQAPEDDQIAQLRDLLLTRELATVSFCADWYKERYEEHWPLYWRAARQRALIEHRFTGDTGPLKKALQQAINSFAETRDLSREMPAKWTTAITGWVVILGGKDDVRELLPLYREMSELAHPWARLMGRCALIILGEDTARSAAVVADILTKDVPYGHPYRTYSSGREMWHLTLVMQEVVQALGRDEPDLLLPFVWRLYSPWVAARNAKALAGWRHVTRKALSQLSSGERVAEADAFATKLLMAADRPNPRYEILPRSLGYLRRDLEGKRVSCAERLAPDEPRAPLPAEMKAGWDAYDFERLPVRLNGGSPVHACATADTIYFMDASNVTAYSAAGRAQRILAETGRAKWPICATVGEENLYVGTTTGLLTVPLDGEGETIFSETTGLPGGKVTALTWHRGKTYVGLSSASYRVTSDRRNESSGFAVFDPKARSFQVIASVTGKEPRTDLSGGGYYRIGAILPDPKRDLLWLGLCWGNTPRRGLWQYFPATGKAKLVWPLERWQGIAALEWLGETMLAYGPGFGVVTIDPTDQSKTWLISFGGRFWNGPEGVLPPPLFGSPLCHEPRIYDGEGFIYCNVLRDTLYLLRRGRRKPMLRELPDGTRHRYRSLIRTQHGVLLITDEAKVYLLKPKKVGKAE